MTIRVNSFDISFTSGIIFTLSYLPHILQGVRINVSKMGNTESFSKTQFMVHHAE